MSKTPANVAAQLAEANALLQEFVDILSGKQFERNPTALILNKSRQFLERHHPQPRVFLVADELPSLDEQARINRQLAPKEQHHAS